MFEYQKSGQYFALIAGGMEEHGAEEFTELGAQNVKLSYRGIQFEADPRTLYILNYQTRLATRILAPLISFNCHSTDYLYKVAKSVDWTTLFRVDQTFAVFASVANSHITHSQYAALKVKDAIVDCFREKFGSRPNVEPVTPDVWINIHIENNHAVLSLDTSGGSLHRRGYRTETGVSPMMETLAAAIIRLTEWQGEKPLYDPMCGSGTLLCEALMSYCRIPAGYLRKNFGFMFLPDFDKTVWETVREEAYHNFRQLPEGLIAGSDVSGRATKIAIENVNHISSGNRVTIKMLNFMKIDNLENRVIVCNPPYGIREGNPEEIAKLYTYLGDYLKQKCKGSTAYIYVGDKELLKFIGLKPTWKKPLVNGALDGRLAKYEMY
ncbi:MAG: RNA methyltransferase [Candidatus Marinimicrobia bacterium CG08_land_8_20_14_0_20_45_22]|nr:MAG: RNA methyltransferase [Candidatus Marinimicrobia bacterium CG08_land_8_20_14_0_20_45_22]